MDHVDFIEALAIETVAMRTALESVDLGSPVPTCPGWSVQDLVIHTGQVHRHKTVAVRDNWRSGAPPWPNVPDGDVLPWFDKGIAEMLDVFRNADLNAPTWTWCDHDHTAAWWVRRMAHETLIHGADAVLAAGGSPKVNEALAEDGIDEILFEMMVGAPAWAELTVGDRSVTIAAPHRRWTLRTASWDGRSPGTGKAYVDEPAVVFAADDAAPDAEIVGAAAALDFWLWGRGDLPTDAVRGDAALAASVRSVAAEATQ